MPPFLDPHAPMQQGPSAADRRTQHQQMIARIRGDAGYLAGFSGGQPLAASRIKPPSDPGGGYFVDEAQPLVINNYDGPLAIAVGDGNVIQQQVAHGDGPIGQQQVATTKGEPLAGGPAKNSADASALETNGVVIQSAGGAVNIVRGAGNVVQQPSAGARSRR
jgi:hypothetical protein